jgi:hypothetical protein
MSSSKEDIITKKKNNVGPIKIIFWRSAGPHRSDLQKGFLA